MEGSCSLSIGRADIRSVFDEFLDMEKLPIHGGCQEGLIYWSHGQEQRQQGTEGAECDPSRGHVSLQIGESRGRGL